MTGYRNGLSTQEATEKKIVLMLVGIPVAVKKNHFSQMN